MANKRGAIAALAAGAAVAASAIAVMRRTRRLQAEARDAGAHVPYGPYEAVVKRPLDLVVSTAGLVALSPVIIATALAVRRKLGSPIIFKQFRPGLNGKPFEIYKFRTMTDERDAQTAELLPDEVRLTRFGMWLRSTSLAPVIIGHPGRWEPTNSLEHTPKTLTDLRKCKFCPGLFSSSQIYSNTREKLSFAYFGDLRRVA